MNSDDDYPKKKVLVVEDDERILDTLKDVFLMGGYDVKTAENGKEGIKAFIDYNPDIVITDIVMPEMDGIDMVKEIRKTDPDIKVIYITAWFQREDIARRMNEELRKHPHYRLMKKPFKIENVWKMTERYLAE